jgi:hypothetical protein
MTIDKMFQGKYKSKPLQYELKGIRYNYKVFNSGYYENQLWGSLHKNWLGYIIACQKFEFDKKIRYARRIRRLQRELALDISEFECLNY